MPRRVANGLAYILFVSVILIVIYSEISEGAKLKKKCVYNGKKYKKNRDVTSFTSHCLTLKCSYSKSTQVSKLKLKSIKDCTCSLSKKKVKRDTREVVKENNSRRSAVKYGRKDKTEPKTDGSPKRNGNRTRQRQRVSKSEIKRNKLSAGKRQKSSNKPKNTKRTQSRNNNNSNLQNISNKRENRNNKPDQRKSVNSKSKNKPRINKRPRKPVSRQKPKTVRQKTPKCKYNASKYKNNKIVAKKKSRCLILRCVVSNNVATVQAEVMTSCTCKGTQTVTSATTSAVAPTTAATKTCDDYKQFTSEHSMCKALNTDCKIKRQGVTDEEKAKILKMHNELRQKVAKGEETQGDPGPQPAGSNIRELKWNDELALVAQAWSNTCPSGHDCYDCRKITERSYVVGQNIYYSWGFSADEQWENGINGWYNEVADMPNTLVPAYGNPTSGKVIGHYTQLVWGKSYEIGCGAVYFGPCTLGLTEYQECKTYVCNYGEAGNFLGSPVYTSGTAASACTSGTSTTYDGLCQ